MLMKKIILIFSIMAFSKNSIAFSNESCGVIGGGHYIPNRIFTHSVNYFEVTDYESLIKEVEAGHEYIYIPSNTTIHIPNLPRALEIKSGQTLFSDRGVNGSPGGRLLVSENENNNEDNYPVITIGSNARVTGLRIEGPVKEAESVKKTIGIQTLENSKNIQIDNNELHGWPWAAFSIKKSKNASVNHNYIHHNIKSGLGYGVVVQNGNASAEISCNVFDANRHAIAGSGLAGEGYYAHHNLVMNGGGRGAYHQFDMHSDNDGNGGKYVIITDNWFNFGDYGTSNRSSAMIRGVPTDGSATIKRNWVKSSFYITDTTTAFTGVKGSILDDLSLIAHNIFNVDFKFEERTTGNCVMSVNGKESPVICEGVGF